MSLRRSDGTALLIAAHGAVLAPALEASALHALGQIGEALLATGAAWRVERLAATAGARFGADRGTIKRHLDELSMAPARAAVVVVLGTLAELGGEPALVTGANARAYPEDAALPLAWIRERLAHARAEQLVVVVSAVTDGDAPFDPAPWLRALATWKPNHLVCAGAAAAERHPLADALLAGLCGDALDPRTGTVTMASLSAHLARRADAAALQASELSATLAQPPPLAGLWDVRRAQLSMRQTRPRRAPSVDPSDDARDELVGTVLPGRFRLDALVARGTFGTVYRARQLAVERDVAVKVLHAEIDPSSEDGRLFVHEVRSVGRLDHANVVRIHQADMTQDGRLFYAMELLDGRDLQQVAGDAPLPRARAVALVQQLLAGLGAAHDAALVHADVKPANAIVVGRDGAERLVLVDFGLSRLRAPDRPAESAGGTPAYMAPEQLHLGRVDARSDLFSAALVLVFLMTGWRRPNALAVVPPLDAIDADLRAVLARALALEPNDRFQSAQEFSDALDAPGEPVPPSARAAPPVAPFRHLASLTEADRGRLHGREAELATLTEHALYRRAVIYTAPSGTGKTSLLRAGLVPRLELLGARAVYLAARPGALELLAGAIWPGAATVAEAVAQWHQQRGGKLAIVLDRLEAALGDDPLVEEALAFDRWPAGADVTVILAVREDQLARLVARTQALEPNIAIVRLPPLDPAGARAAIVGPLVEARLAIEPALLDALLADLQGAAAAIGPTMGWGTAPAIFPPHLQLACSVLYEALAPGEATLTLAHYDALGGFGAIVGEHLDRVLEELPDGRAALARDLFVALVTAAHERAQRPEAELLERAPETLEVLEVLRARGLVVRVRGPGGDASWELAHDSLIPRVLAWLDRQDLARRRAVELVRFHLRRTRAAGAPSLLGRAELREVANHPGAIADLDGEWQRLHQADAWTPARLVARSRLALRRQIAVFAALVVALVAIGGASWRQHAREVDRAAAEDERVRREASLRDRDLGTFVLSLEPYDWDPILQRPIAVDAAQVPLAWALHKQTPDEDVGDAYATDLLVRGAASFSHGALLQPVEAKGGRAFLVVARGPCAPSAIPLRDLPGYASRARAPAVLHIKVPTCEATRASTIAIPAGTFVYGGAGEPASTALTDESPPEAVRANAAFRIDATEVTNAAFDVFQSLADATGVRHPKYPGSAQLHAAGAPGKPVSGVRWAIARAYCRYVGKRLPTDEEWTRALRGPLVLAGGAPNPAPKRNYPWGTQMDRETAARYDAAQGTGPIEVGALAIDRSVEGVLDLGGNVSEWTDAPPRDDGSRYIRGGTWGYSRAADIADYDAIQNLRPEDTVDYSIGFRCVE